MTKQVNLENTMAGGFGLPTGQIVPGGGSIVVEPEIWAASKDHPVVKSRVDAGTLIVDGKGKKAEVSADIGVLQARVTELEATVKAKDEEITTLKAGATPAPTEDHPKTAADVLATAETVHFQTFKADATKILGDATPSTKDDIVEALKAKAAE